MNLTIDGEFRYIINWFDEWSELQRDDFFPILVEYLTKDTPTIYMNGVVSSMANSTCNDRPMNLFQCRVKLFKQWSKNWPEDFKIKLKNNIIEIDPKYGDKLKKELNMNGSVSPSEELEEENNDNEKDSENDENIRENNNETLSSQDETLSQNGDE